jgi:divinyl protochlorophyllide a 8-vinyl-reductase
LPRGDPQHDLEPRSGSPAGTEPGSGSPGEIALETGTSGPAAPSDAVPAPARPDAAAPGRIGPNAIIRTLEALRAAHGEVVTREVLRIAGLAAYADAPPAAMVDEAVVVRLHVTLANVLGGDEQAAIAAEAGRLTARYLLAHRIPTLARFVLRVLPAGLALPLLRRAIARHAWTFAGSGRFAWSAGGPIRLDGGPFALRPDAASLLAPFYAATFETLLRALVDRRSRVIAVLDDERAPRACLLLQLRP